MSDYTVVNRGRDTSGRSLYATRYMWDWWEQVTDTLGFTPTITQGAWMARAGGGASASAGYHDLGGCFDLRVWDLTGKQIAETIRVIRQHGAAAWLRDKAHGGFADPHIHLVLGTDHPLTAGAASQWRQYMQGLNGLGGRSAGPDYHWRPKPLVLEPPEDDMASAKDEILAKIDESQREIGLAIRKFNKANAALIRAQFRKLGTEIDKDTEAILRELEKD